jgi:hypothetical protein
MGGWQKKKSEQWDTAICSYCGQRMTKYFRYDLENDNWIKSSAFYQACFNPDCPLQRAEVIGTHSDGEGHIYKFSLV